MSEEVTEVQEGRVQRRPDWLRVKLPTGESYRKVREIVSEHKLHTICQSGNCPNMGECWGAGTATFMILGNVCTRSCGFCSVATGRPDAVDPFEPARVARSVELMGVKHCVITSVDRDDLKDGGSDIWAKTIRAIRRRTPDTTMETLIPDFQGIWSNLAVVLEAAPDILSHNLETVRRLTKQVRIQAKYDRSLEVLMRSKRAGLRTKCGVMLGLGVLWIVTEVIHMKHGVDQRGDLMVTAVLRRIDLPSVLFFLGILVAVAGLQVAGHLTLMAQTLDKTLGNIFLINGAIGVLSSIVDNVPLVAAAMGMYPMSQFPVDHLFWELLALCAGTGGSLLIIGSAAGVAAMGILHIDFVWYVKKMTFPAALGYFGGIITFWLMWH